MRREPFVSDLFFQLDLRLNSEKGGDTSTYVTNGEWDLKGEPRHVVLLSFCVQSSLHWLHCNVQLLSTWNFYKKLIMPGMNYSGS